MHIQQSALSLSYITNKTKMFLFSGQPDTEQKDDWKENQKTWIQSPMKSPGVINQHILRDYSLPGSQLCMSFHFNRIVHSFRVC